MIGIYKITNMVNGKCYIGQSVDIQKRWRGHRKTMNYPGDHSYNNPLYRAMRKYGIENFSFEVLEECQVSELNNKEKYYIALYNSFFEGYNLTLGGDSSSGQVNKEQIIGIIHDLETTEMYHKEIAKKWNISTEMVQGINTGRYWRQDREYPIQKVSLKRRGTKEKTINYCIDCGKIIDKNSTRCVECSHLSSRKVERPSREELKKLIREKSFLEIGRMFNVSDNAVRKWCDAECLPRKKTKIKQYTDEEWERI